MTPEIRAALGSPVPVSGLTMRVAAAPFKGAGPNAFVVLGIDLRGRDLRLNVNDNIVVSYVAIDSQGKTRGAHTASLTMNLKPETRARAEQSEFRLLDRVDLTPGRWQIRVAAHDGGGGLVGSVLLPVEVPEFNKLPLSMSGIAISSQVASEAPVAYMNNQLTTVSPDTNSAEQPRTGKLHADFLGSFATSHEYDG